jgi:hypothetical protein
MIGRGRGQEPIQPLDQDTASDVECSETQLSGAACVKIDEVSRRAIR